VSHTHDHDHDHGPSTPRRLALSAAIFAVSAALQAAGGFWTGSLGLVSDSLENLNDVLVNVLALTGLALANRREPCERYTYGWHRLEIFNMALGGLLLLGLGAAIVAEAWERFRHPQPILTGWVLGFALAGLLLNLAAAMVLRPRDEDQLKRDASLRTAYVHAFTDSLTSLALVAAMLAIRWTGWRWLDPAVALGILVLILRGALSLLSDALGILMHRAAFDHAEAKARLLGLAGITGVEDLRSWRVCSHLTVCTAHVVVDAERLDDTSDFLRRIEALLASDYGVRHLTVHFETAAMSRTHDHRFVHEHAPAGGHHHG
jgi:cobalt-zinc-cadmium efflux system protein